MIFPEYKIIKDKKELANEIDEIIHFVGANKKDFTAMQKQDMRFLLASYGYQYMEFISEDYDTLADYRIRYYKAKADLMKDVITKAKKVITSNRESYEVAETYLYKDKYYCEVYRLYQPLYKQLEVAMNKLGMIPHICNSLK